MTHSASGKQKSQSGGSIPNGLPSKTPNMPTGIDQYRQEVRRMKRESIRNGHIKWHYQCHDMEGYLIHDKDNGFKTMEFWSSGQLPIGIEFKKNNYLWRVTGQHSCRICGTIA